LKFDNEGITGKMFKANGNKLIENVKPNYSLDDSFNNSHRAKKISDSIEQKNLIKKMS
jgi:hypothetical protein